MQNVVKLLKLVLFFEIALLVQGCGDKVSADKDNLDRNDSRTSASLEQYYLADPSCLDGDGLSNIGERPVYIWQGSGAKPEVYNFSGASSKKSLNNTVVMNTYYGYSETVDCSLKENSSLSCSGKATVDSVPKYLKICKNSEIYPRNSYEGIALSSLANVDHAYKFYSGLSAKIGLLSPITILVIPEVKKRFDKSSSAGSQTKEIKFVTDNMAYAPKFLGLGTLVVYPKSKTSALWRGVNFWEVPWAISHEFGHHVLRSHTGITSLDESGSLTEDDGLYNDVIFTEKRSLPSSNSIMNMETRTVSKDDIWNSVNEGFADLFSFYSLGGQPGLPQNLDCFAVNRDVTSSKFRNAMPKNFTTNVVDEFLSNKESTGSQRCDDPDFQDIHTIGSIVAYGVDQVFSLSRTNPTNEQKANLLLKWADRLAQFANNQDNIKLDELLAAAITVSSQDGRTLTMAQCNKIKEVFGAFSGAWLDGTTSSTKRFDCQN